MYSQWSSDITFLRWQLGLVCQESDATWTCCPARKAFWDTVMWPLGVNCQYLQILTSWFSLVFSLFGWSFVDINWFWAVHRLFISNALWNALLLIWSLSTIYALAGSCFKSSSVKVPYKGKWNGDLGTVKIVWNLGWRSKESQKHKTEFFVFRKEERL